MVPSRCMVPLVLLTYVLVFGKNLCLAHAKAKSEVEHPHHHPLNLPGPGGKHLSPILLQRCGIFSKTAPQGLPSFSLNELSRGAALFPLNLWVGPPKMWLNGAAPSNVAQAHLPSWLSPGRAP